MEYITIALLVIIACSELYRTYLGARTPTKKDHFLSKVRGTRTMIWDLEFKIFKTREIREEVRNEYDMMRARMETLQKQLENFPADGKKEDKAALEDQLLLTTNDAQRFLAQIENLDVEVEGAKPSEKYPDGAAGITHQIDSLRELESMLKDWVKTL